MRENINILKKQEIENDEKFQVLFLKIDYSLENLRN